MPRDLLRVMSLSYITVRSDISSYKIGEKDRTLDVIIDDVMNVMGIHYVDSILLC